MTLEGGGLIGIELAGFRFCGAIGELEYEVDTRSRSELGEKRISGVG